MAVVALASFVSFDTNSLMRAGIQIAGELYAGEDLFAGALCYIASDGTVMLSDGTANDAASAFHGICPRDANADEPVTLYGPGARCRYGSSLTPGAPLYVAATAGRADTGATTGGLTPVAICIDDQDIMVMAVAVK